jgi:type I restriction enzyme S subunit
MKNLAFMDLPKEWEMRLLGDIVDVLDKLRKPITKRDRLQGEYPYYGATGILSYINEFIFSEKLVLIGEDGAKWASGDNTSFIATGKYWVNNHAHVVRPNRKLILDEWMVYYLNHNDLTPFITGMTVPKLNQEKMRSIPIPLPPLSEQRRIVSILDNCFAAIDKAKANAEKNLQNARELFESYLQGVFETGGNWQNQKLGDVCGFVRGPFGGSLKKNIFKKDGFAIYEQQHAIYDNFETIRYFIDENKFNEMKRFELKSGDLIMSCSGTIGKIAIAPENIKKGIINQALLKLSPSKKVSNIFLKLWMQSESFQNSLKEYAGGAAIQNVASVAILKNIQIPLPELSRQEEICENVGRFSEETEKLKALYAKKLADLEELKKSLLEKALRGELS